MPWVLGVIALAVSLRCAAGLLIMWDRRAARR
jgi:hypothetical protein